MYVKHMLSFRCREKIEQELDQWGIIAGIDQGLIEFQHEPTFDELYLLKERLPGLGFELADEGESRIIMRSSETINGLLLHCPEMPLHAYPEYLEQETGVSAAAIGNLFAQVFGVGLLRYILVLQVERMKEMILYEDRDLNEVAAIFHCQNETQLAIILGQVNGLKPSFYKQVKKERSEVRKLNGFARLSAGKRGRTHTSG
jgi:AraC-like DNA-binding protein